VDQFLLSSSVGDASRCLNLIGNVETLPKRHGEKITENFSNNIVISQSDLIRRSTNDLLRKYDMSSLPEFVQEPPMDDEIPF
jgi:hypothetical protein